MDPYIILTHIHQKKKIILTHWTPTTGVRPSYKSATKSRILQFVSYLILSFMKVYGQIRFHLKRSCLNLFLVLKEFDPFAVYQNNFDERCQINPQCLPSYLLRKSCNNYEVTNCLKSNEIDKVYSITYHKHR